MRIVTISGRRPIAAVPGEPSAACRGHCARAGRKAGEESAGLVAWARPACWQGLDRTFPGRLHRGQGHQRCALLAATRLRSQSGQLPDRLVTAPRQSAAHDHRKQSGDALYSWQTLQASQTL